MRHFIELSYKGTHYHGWQIQHNATSVQEVINNAIAKILRLESVGSMGGGRTDAGVHALQQYMHIDLDFSNLPGTTLDDLHFKLNNFLPSDIAIHRIVPVAENANARFDATSRRYHYIISKTKNALATGLAMPFYYPLSLPLMQEALDILKEYTDFKCFALTGGAPGSHHRCTIIEAKISENKHFIIIELKANRFLRGMVRSIVGTLLNVGRGKTSLAQFREIIELGDRKLAGRSAPPDGLYLSQVVYPQHIIEESEDALKRLTLI
ncbi:MAG: tRNA pseudouridine synthase A [Syntrophomonadaceae bacterium]|nr:tRNA pseudouridine synthase A [Bacillota bacterium]